jgi:predicted PurR-regulated permease PerM
VPDQNDPAETPGGHVEQPSPDPDDSTTEDRDPMAEEGGGHPVPPSPDSERPPLEETEGIRTNRGVDRAVIIGEGLKELSRWSGRFILVAIATAIFLWLLGQLWVGVLPVLLALIVSTMLWPPTRWLRSKGLAPGAAAGVTLLASFLIFLGILTALAPSVIGQSQEVLDKASEGLQRVREWLVGPPLNLDPTAFDTAIEQATEWAQGRAGDIASGVFTGISAVGSAVVTGVMVLVLTFFFIKDGPRFLPWLRSVAGRRVGRHLTEVLTRMWSTLGGFIRVQAIVSAVDALFIGLGLIIVGVPLAPALAVLTFFGGFIPIVGAFGAGALAVLVALVTLGLQQALIVLAIIVGVQQLEGNLLQPVLQGRSMQIHAGLILVAVTAGGTLFGIPGAFLAVPIAATLVVLMRYLSEQVDLRAGDLTAAEVAVATPEGQVVMAQAESASRRVAERHRTHRHIAEAEERDEVSASAPDEDSPGTPNPLTRLLGRLRRR